jgi:hypothetical protein
MWETLIVVAVIVIVVWFMVGLWFYVVIGQPHSESDAETNKCANCDNWGRNYCALKRWEKIAQMLIYAPLITTCKLLGCQSFNCPPPPPPTSTSG